MARLIDLGAGRPIRSDDRSIVFLAHDAGGELEVVVTPTLWEQLRIEAPSYCDDEDRRDHALGMIEAAAAERLPTRSSDGRRVVFVG